jgi:hypothetical protein
MRILSKEGISRGRYPSTEISPIRSRNVTHLTAISSTVLYATVSSASSRVELCCLVEYVEMLFVEVVAGTAPSCNYALWFPYAVQAMLIILNSPECDTY